MQENQTNPNLQNSTTLGAAPPGGIVPTLVASGAEPVHSLVEMVQRDLDAALQLLADRAQYITGASGAAIALRRDGRNDMLCRASAGSNAPELGALLSAEYGLSGESVRTRRLLRCDDAERDSRVNRDVCRQLGIASVVVMPVVHDDEVLGVFELFSGRAHAFGERDLSAVERLSGMVETAVRLARVTQELPEKLKAEPVAIAEPASPKNEEEIVDEDILEVDVVGPSPTAKVVVEAAKVEVLEAPKIVEAPQIAENVATAVPTQVPVQAAIQTAAVIERPPSKAAEKEVRVRPSAARVERPTVEMLTPPTAVQPPPSVPVAVSAPVSSTPAASPRVSATRKPTFWSAAAVAGESAEATKAEDQSNVPPMLRGLRKCEACGFPISGGRVLCVECEEKKWRGQLRKPQGTPMPTGALPENGARKPEAQALAAVATGSAAGLQATSVISGGVAEAPRKAPAESGKALSFVQATVREPAQSGVGTRESSSLIFSAGLEPSQSWIARNKYVLGVLVLVAAVIAGIVFLR